MTDQKQRIQKVLANAGHGSRRQIESWVRAGRITVNNELASVGQPVGPDDRVAIDGVEVALAAPRRRRVIAYHKPIGELCTRDDPEGRPTIFAALPAPQAGRWVSVGRLDINSVGLVLLTTDGQLANALMHPRNRIVREYHVRVLGDLSAQALEKLRRGVDLDDGRAAFDLLEPRGEAAGANRWYRCRLREGRKREVRRLFEAVGGTVNRLIRTRYGPISLPRDMAPGTWRELSAEQIDALLKTARLDH